VPLEQAIQLEDSWWKNVPTGQATTEEQKVTRVLLKIQAPVVQKVDSVIYQINLYTLESAIGSPNIYPLDSDLPGGPGGGTAIYGLYRYVPLRRVWFSSSLL